MKKILVILLITSIFLVQCYSQYHYLPDEVEYEDFDKLYSFTFKDRAKYRVDDGKYIFKLESDTLLILHSVKDPRFVKFYEQQDTINLNELESIELTEFSEFKTIAFIVAAGLLVLYSKGLIDYLLGDSSPFTGRGLF